MWYADGTGAVFIVTSSDGVSWSAPTTMNGLGGAAHHVQVLYDANRFGLGTAGPKYRIWYWDMNANLYDISSIATAQSVDGVNWVNGTASSQDASAQLVTGAGAGWNRGSYGPVYLFYQPGATNSGVNPWSYSYVMYYDATDGSVEEIGLAYSSDGLFWKAHSGNPVLPVSVGAPYTATITTGAKDLAGNALATNFGWSFTSSPTWDSNYTTFGTVYRDALGFHFWYSGGAIASSEGIGYAFSTDGKTWTKNANHIFHISDMVSYRNTRVYTPAVIDDGTGVLKMYYSAQATGGAKKIGRATLSP
jgi:Bacterial Ig-like domain